MNDFTGRVRRDEWKPPAGFQRTVTLALDTAQYQLDMESMAETKSEDIYSTFNLLMRRKPKACGLLPCPGHLPAVQHVPGLSKGIPAISRPLSRSPLPRGRVTTAQGWLL